MSLALHLAALERESLMPAISRPKAEVTSLGNGFSIGKQVDRPNSSAPNKIHGMKEFSLINHIESLKSTAYGDLCTTGDSSKSSHDLPYISLSRLCHRENNPSPSTSKWAIDPGSVDGNLRVNSSNRNITCTLEDVVSRVSSCAKQSDACEDDEIVEKSSNKSRKKSAKGTKKKAKRKDSRSSIQYDKDTKQSLPSSVFSEFKKKRHSFNDLNGNSCDLTVLTALCQSIKIHQKQPNNISVKDVPFSKSSKKSSSVINTMQRKSVSPARTSLSNAMHEYNKKQSSSNSDQRRRHGGSVADDISKTKVFLSEKQSGLITDCGNSFPCAPPATPTTDQLKRIEYVPSLQDIRSQRSIRQRLLIIESKALKKERKKQEDMDKVEKLSLRERRLEKKKWQRMEIYALNKLMTEFEHERFKQFMSQAGSNI